MRIVPSLLALAAFATAQDSPPLPIAPVPSGDTFADAVAPDLIVTADRTPGAASRATAAVEVIDATDMAEAGHPMRTVDLLRAGVAVDMAGSRGVLGSGNLRLRGTDAGDTRVLVDGIPVRDGSSINGQQEFGALDPVGVDRIEIVRGMQGGAHGSGAIGGVVNLLTRRPTAIPKAGIRLEGGSFGTAAAEAWATGAVPTTWVGYALTVGGLTTDGYSFRTPLGQRGAPTHHEADGARRGSLGLRLEATPAPGLRLYVAARSEHRQPESDGSFAADPPEDRLDEERTRVLRRSAGVSYDQEWAGASIDVARSDLRRVLESAVGPYEQRGIDDFGGLQVWGAALRPQGSRTGFDALRLTLGLDAEVNRGRDNFGLDIADHQRGLWAQALAGGARWEASQSVRREVPAEGSSVGTWRSAGAVFLGWSRLHAALATAFRAPSAYQRHGAYVGNADLEAVRSRGVEVGHATTIPALVTVSHAAFRTTYQQGIGYTGSQFVNTGVYRVQGIEQDLVVRPEQDGLRVRLTATVQRTDLSKEEQRTRDAFTYQPSAHGVVEPSWHAPQGWVAVRVAMRARSTVSASVPTVQEVPGSAVLSASGGFYPAHGWTVYARGENLSSTRWESFPGNSTSPLAGYGGVEAEF